MSDTEREEQRDSAMTHTEIALKNAIQALSWLGRGRGHLHFADGELRAARRAITEAETAVQKALAAEKEG